MSSVYYADDYVTIYHGDCREVLPLVGPVDVVLTDPPYGVNATGEYDDSVFPDWWIPIAWTVAPRVLCMPGNKSLMRAGAAFGGAYRDLIALYAVNGMTRSPIAFGNYIPVIAAGDWKWEARPNLIKFIVNTDEKIDHPTPKPYEAMKRLIATYSKSEWLILDPFMGSGTTLRAAKDLGRRAIGIELEERYCEIAARRMAQSVMQFEEVAA